MINTEILLTVLVNKFNRILPTYREDAPEAESDECYCVLTHFKHTDVPADQPSDLVFFYADFYGDDRLPNDSTKLIGFCDQARSELDGEIIGAADVFGGHLNFEQTIPEQETDFDINHRRQEWTARVFWR